MAKTSRYATSSDFVDDLKVINWNHSPSLFVASSSLRIRRWDYCPVLMLPFFSLGILKRWSFLFTFWLFWWQYILTLVVLWAFLFLHRGDSGSFLRGLAIDCDIQIHSINDLWWIITLNHVIISLQRVFCTLRPHISPADLKLVLSTSSWPSVAF